MNPSQYRLLVVDDSRMIRLAVRSAMQQLNSLQIEVLEAEDGLDAMNKLRQQSVDLIVTDLEMPQMDGFSFISKLREDAKYEDVPILFLTSHTETQKKVQAFELGATDYITKPFISQEFQARVRGYLERRSAYKVIRRQQDQMQEELKQAREMQAMLFPLHLPPLEKARIICHYEPMQQIGGDFYDVFEIQPGKIGIMVADVSGHGIPAALLSFMISGIFKHSATNLLSTCAVLQLANSILYGKLPDGKFATMFYAIYDTQTHRLTYTSASHPPPCLLRQGNPEIIPLKTNGRFIGPFDNTIADYSEASLILQPQDKLLLYTDGIVEVSNPQKRMWGFENFRGFLRERAHLPLAEIITQLMAHGRQYAGHQGFNDDVTIVGLEVFA